MRIRIEPSCPAGRIQAPASKSMAHRLLICAGLADGISTIHHVEASEDILATMDCLKALGVSCVRKDGDVEVHGNGAAFSSGAELCCRESGSTLRFLIPLCLLDGEYHRMRGSEKLMSRPLSVYQEICKQQNLLFQAEEGQLLIKGPLSADIFRIPGGISSQFLSGLLFALPLLESSSLIRLIPPVESRSYIFMTIRALEEFGVTTRFTEEFTLEIPGGQRYHPRTVTVEGDCSNAAFLDALNLAGGNVQVEGLSEDTLQGDAVYSRHLEALRRGPAEIDLSDCPDLGPVLFAAAAACHGGTFTGTRRLRLKESDRVEAMAAELKKFGVSCDAGENSFRVPEGKLQRPVEMLNGHNDHRVVMALAVLCCLTGGEIEDAQAVRKSYPDFWQRLKELNVRWKEIGLDQ